MEEINGGIATRSGSLMLGFDLIDVVEYMSRTNKKYQATLLAQIEEVLEGQPENYRLIRKLVLDSTNNYLRTVVKTIYGGIEI